MTVRQFAVLLLLCLLLLVSCVPRDPRDTAGSAPVGEQPTAEAQNPNETETPDTTDTEAVTSEQDADAPPNVEDDRWSYYY